MIADQPVAAASVFQTFGERVNAFLESAVAASADGLTWQEFGELMLALLRLSMQAIDTAASMTGPQKKELVLEAVAALFDLVADRAVPIYLAPLWMLARPAVRSLVIALAAGAVEQLLPLVRLP